MLMRLPDKSEEVAHSSERRENNWTCGTLEGATPEADKLLTSSHEVWTFGYNGQPVSGSQKEQLSKLLDLRVIIRLICIVSHGAKWLIGYYRKK